MFWNWYTIMRKFQLLSCTTFIFAPLSMVASYAVKNAIIMHVSFKDIWPWAKSAIINHNTFSRCMIRMKEMIDNGLFGSGYRKHNTWTPPSPIAKYFTICVLGNSNPGKPTPFKMHDSSWLFNSSKCGED